MMSLQSTKTPLKIMKGSAHPKFVSQKNMRHSFSRELTAVAVRKIIRSVTFPGAKILVFHHEDCEFIQKVRAVAAF